MRYSHTDKNVHVVAYPLHKYMQKMLKYHNSEYQIQFELRFESHQFQIIPQKTSFEWLIIDVCLAYETGTADKLVQIMLISKELCIIGKYVIPIKLAEYLFEVSGFQRYTYFH